MVRLNPKQRTALADTFRQLANLAVGGLAIGQFVTAGPVSWSLLAAGCALWVVFVAFGLVLVAGEDA
jgi:hypothetical protein